MNLKKLLAVQSAIVLALIAVLASAGLSTPVFAAPGNISRVSLSSSEEESNGSSDWPTMSSDGRYVAFYSEASNLVPGDTNGIADVFVRDMQTGTTTRVSVSSSGVQSNADSHDAVISGNGRYVTFISLATNLVSQTDIADTYDIFVHDLQTSTTTAVSVTLDNTLGTLNSYHQTISDDGRYIAFNSSVGNFVSGDTNSASDVFVWDMQTAALTRASVSSSGTQSDDSSFYTGISSDGRYITFHSAATNLVSGDTNGLLDIFLHDMQTGSTTRVSVSSGGTQSVNGDSMYPAISSTGRYVVFQSQASNLVTGDGNNKWDIFRHDLQTGTTSLVSIAANGGFADNDSVKSAVSSDGRYVVFDSDAANLVTGDTNSLGDAFLRDMQTGTTMRVSVDASGIQSIGGATFYPSITPNGQYIAYKSFATNLVSGDTNSSADIFVFEQDPLQGVPTATPTSTESQVSFPSTGILDNFNRSNGAIGNSWSGSTTGYSIAGQKLDVGAGQDIYWNMAYQGVDQEAYVTLSTIDPGASEVALMLKAQSNIGISPGQLAVVYSPSGNVVEVWTNNTSNGWLQQGTDISASFSNGDQFGVRARASGLVEVYKNGSLLGTRSVASWPYYGYGGYIGLFNLNASSMILDNFGGGTMSGSPTLTPTPGPCTDPSSCNPVHAIPALWRCDIAECTSADWTGAVIGWPSWSAYQSNARTGDNSRSVYSFGNQPLYPYMGSWADGCQVTAVTGVTLIIEWQRGTNTWRETYLDPGQSHTIDLISPEDGAMIEAPNGSTSFSVSLSNCNPQNITGTVTPTYTPTATQTTVPTATYTPTNTPSLTPTATYTATNTPSLTPSSTFTPTKTATSTPTFTLTPTNTSTFTPTSTVTPTHTPSLTPTPTFTATNTPSLTPTSTYTPTNTLTLTSTSTYTPTNTPTLTPTWTFTPTNTSTAQPTHTYTPTSTLTHTPTSTATITSSPTATNTASSTATVSSITLTTTPSSYDGWLIESAETSGVGGSLNRTATTLRVGDDASNRQYRAILSFDTFLLPENAEITSVTLKFKYAGVSGTSPFKTHGSLLADICKGAFKGSATLQVGDFTHNCGSNKVLIYTNSRVDNWYTKSLDPLRFDLINRDGTTQFRLRFTKDDNNDFGADFLKIFSANASAGSQPQLIIEYVLH